MKKPRLNPTFAITSKLNGKTWNIKGKAARMLAREITKAAVQRILYGASSTDKLHPHD